MVGRTARNTTGDPTGDTAVTGDPEANRLVNTDGTALLIAMLLDQQVPLEWAFAGPARLRDRLGHLDATRIAASNVDDIVAAAVAKPALHRYPAAMARRIHALATALTDDYGGVGANVWTGLERDDADLLAGRLAALPGFGDEKVQITIAVLAKRFGVTPSGWQTVAGVFSDDEPRSVADIHDAASHAAVRDWKKAQTRAGLDKQGRPL